MDFDYMFSRGIISTWKKKKEKLSSSGTSYGEGRGVRIIDTLTKTLLGSFPCIFHLFGSLITEVGEPS